MNDVIFTERGIKFEGYPYAPSSVYPDGEILYTEIQEINSSAAPPEAWTKDGDILFVSATQREELKAKAKENNIPDVSRIDVWDLILEPFLDTAFSEEEQERTIKLLEKQGVVREEIMRLREEVKDAMIAYNFDSMLWDWVHLGLTDILDARLGKLSGERFRLSETEFAEFYKKAIALARKGKVFNFKAE